MAKNNSVNALQRSLSQIKNHLAIKSCPQGLVFTKTLRFHLAIPAS
jgi:hypothetical protein